MTEPVLRLKCITKRFGPLLANDDISLEVQRGEVLALLGENGAGKSTLVAILFGHYVADEGSIEAFGRATTKADLVLISHPHPDHTRLEQIENKAKAKIIEYPTSKGESVRLGIIDLPSFYAPLEITGKKGKSEPESTTTEDVARLIKKLEQEKVSGIILDLRRNRRREPRTRRGFVRVMFQEDLREVQRLGDDVMHVQVAISGQPPQE